MKTIIIGGGPAGMMAAISAAKKGDNVILIEKNKSLGKKLLITGKGRCNITSSLEMNEFILNTPGNGKFLYSAFQNFTNKDIINFLKEHGLEVKNERGNRIFPVTDKAQDVLNCFIKELNNLKVDIRFNSEAVEIGSKNGEVTGVYLDNGDFINGSKVILATGGKSYPTTGSDGRGYKLAEKLGHTIKEVKGSIIPLLADTSLCQSIQGLSLKNVKIKIKDIRKAKNYLRRFWRDAIYSFWSKWSNYFK